MKVFRFAVHPEEDGFYFLECLNDARLFTQARSMDEALYMARDVIETVYEISGFLIEFVIPPDVVTSHEQKQQRRRQLQTVQPARRKAKSLTGRR